MNFRVMMIGGRFDGCRCSYICSVLLNSGSYRRRWWWRHVICGACGSGLIGVGAAIYVASFLTLVPIEGGGGGGM